MSDRFRFVLLLPLFCLAAALPAGGKKEAAPDVTTVQVTGRVRMVGSGNFNEIIISAEEGNWYVAKEEENKLIDLQQQTVTVQGEETVVELRFANGQPAGRRRTLSNVKVIAVE
ncbi:MAG: hypothetical protein FWG99_03540 [Treponema sp.]|nr:hypothetical protein [Treponema sp.]